jgi:hypothetical protein
VRVKRLVVRRDGTTTVLTRSKDLGRLAPQQPAVSSADRLRSAANVASNLIPVVGGSVTALLDAIFTEPLQRRRDRFMGKLAEAVDYLIEHGLTDEDLSANEAFISACSDAARIAVGEHLEAKLDMLKACLIHQALPHDLDDLVASRFMQWVDDLDPRHLLVLQYAANPPAWFDEHGISKADYMMASRHTPLEAAGLGFAGEVMAFVLADLGERRLADTGLLSGGVSSTSVYGPWISDLGKLFLNWVTIV